MTTERKARTIPASQRRAERVVAEQRERNAKLTPEERIEQARRIINELYPE